MISRWTLSLSILAIAAIAGCGKQANPPGTLGNTGTTGVTINGAGATFPYPIYAKWADKYNQLTGVKVNYQSIGSGGGVQQIKAGTVDFGASDAPLKSDELDKADLLQFPMVMGGVVPVVNVKGIAPGCLQLTSDILAGIYLGTIKKWNDPAVVKENPGVTLPDKDITVVSRADGSGTTWIFTNYLDATSKDWHAKVGFGKSVNWPVGIRGKGNEGVAAYVQRLDGTIGYVEYAYASQNKMSYVKLRNKAGKYVAPSIESFQAAAAGADWAKAPGFYVVLTNQPGEKSWPISGATYIIVHRKTDKPEIAKATLDFFNWSYTHGTDMAKELDYVPMPEGVVKLVTEKWKSDLTANGKPVWE